MATVIAVEPNALLRLGILQLLEKMPCDITLDGIGYAQLFKSVPGQGGVDLMLLSVPDVYERMLELVAAAQRGYSPKRIILLSDTPTLTYSLLNRSEEHTSELQSLMRISYAVFCLKKK